MSPLPLLCWGAFALVEATLMLWVDRPVARWAATLPSPVVTASRWLTLTGDGLYTLLPLGLASLALLVARTWTRGEARRRLERWLAVAAFLFLAGALSGLLVDVIKEVVGRPRPRLFLEHGLYLPEPFQLAARFRSFPSGHANTMVALALALGCLGPRWRWPLLALALTLATTRLWLGAHYPSDLLAGAAVAVLTTPPLHGAFARRGWLFAPGGAMVRP